MRSMTAFGRAVAAGGGCEITVEIRSVNNRFLDCSIRLPRAYAALEEQVKAVLSEAGIVRGKVDVSACFADPRLTSGNGGLSPVVLEPDTACAEGYVKAAAILSKVCGVENDLTVSRLLALPGVMVPLKDESGQKTEEEAWTLLCPVLREAAARFTAAREREGARLGDDLTRKLNDIRCMTASLATRSRENIGSYRERFEERIRAAVGISGVAIEEGRILTECAIYADRVAIDEELVRLDSHFDTLQSLFNTDGPVGRKVDFMLQEVNREVNTIGSKCADADMARTVADIKSELEKIREQIQNIE